MAEKAVIIGLFGGLLVSAGVLWAKMPPRPEIRYSNLSQTTTGTAPIRSIPIDRPVPLSPAEKEVLQATRDKLPPELPAWAEHHTGLLPIAPPQYQPKEVMPSDQPTAITKPKTPDTRPRQVPLPKRRPVGAVNRPHCVCKAVVRRIYVLPQDRPKEPG